MSGLRWLGLAGLLAVGVAVYPWAGRSRPVDASTALPPLSVWPLTQQVHDVARFDVEYDGVEPISVQGGGVVSTLPLPALSGRSRTGLLVNRGPVTAGMETLTIRAGSRTTEVLVDWTWLPRNETGRTPVVVVRSKVGSEACGEVKLAVTADDRVVAGPWVPASGDTVLGDVHWDCTAAGQNLLSVRVRARVLAAGEGRGTLVLQNRGAEYRLPVVVVGW